MYDEETGEWVPKWGYKGSNKKNENEWLVELPDNPSKPEGQTGDVENPRTVLKKDRKARVSANEGRRVRNSGEEIAKKKGSFVAKEVVVTRKLAQRLRKVRVGKTLGGRAGRRK